MTSLSLVLPWLALAQGIDHSERLSGPLSALLTAGDVEAFDLAPDGSWALYRAPQDSSTPGLYAVLTDGSQDAVLLSAPGASVGAFAIDPSGARAVFLSGPDLFRMSPAGVVVRLNPPLSPGAAVLDFVLSPDGTRALYRADQEVLGRVDLYTVNLAGMPQSVRVSRVGPAGGGVSRILVAPGSQRVVFAGDLVVDAREELFSAPLDGSQPDVALCGSFVAGGGLNQFPQAPLRDDSRVAYLADQLTDGKFELFSVPIDGSALPVRLNDALPAQGDVLEFQLAGGRVAFTADALVDTRPELYAAPLDGSQAAVKLNVLATPVQDFVLAASGTKIAYADQYCNPPSSQIWSVPADGSAAPTSLANYPFCSVGATLSLTPDETAALYLLSSGGINGLFRVPLDGSSAPLEILPQPQTTPIAFRLSPDGQRLVVLAEFQNESGRVLAAAPADGSAPAVALHAVGGLQVGPRDDLELTDQYVAFRADIERREVLELFGVPLDGSSAPRRLSEDLLVTPSVTDVTSFALAPDGSRLGYTTGLGAYSLELSPRLTRTLDSSFAPPEGSRGSMRITPDGSRLFWVGPATGSHLFAAPFDASQPPVRLSSGAFASGFGAGAARFSPDGSRYAFGYSTYFGPGPIYGGPTDLSSLPVFLEGATIQGLTYLASEVVYAHTGYNPYYPTPTSFRRRPLDLSGPAVELVPTPQNFPPPSGALAVTPDGTRVLFVRDEQSPGKHELYSMLLTPGAQPQRLDDVLGADRSVLPAVYPTPDSTRVVYMADRDANDVFELYVVPVDGSQPPLELSGTLVNGGDVGSSSSFVTSAWITPDSSRVVYMADALVDNRFDLYSVPLDGSTSPALLVPGPGQFGSSLLTEAGAVQLSPDGSRLYVRTNFFSSVQLSLASVPVAGGPLVHLGSPPLPSSTMSLPYVVLADGRVVYRMNLASSTRHELWIAPGDRPGRSLRRSHLAHAAGSVEADFAVDEAGGWIYYRADAQVDGEIELFRHPLDPTPPVKRR